MSDCVGASGAGEAVEGVFDVGDGGLSCDDCEEGQDGGGDVVELHVGGLSCNLGVVDCKVDPVINVEEVVVLLRVTAMIVLEAHVIYSRMCKSPSAEKGSEWPSLACDIWSDHKLLMVLD